MWLFTLSGFASIVQDAEDRDRLVVRARIAVDLDELRKYVPDLTETISLAGRDYPYRATCSRAGLALGLARHVYALDYGNFKRAVGERRGWDRERLYEGVWATMYGAESTLNGASGANVPPTQPFRRRRRRRIRITGHGGSR